MDSNESKLLAELDGTAQDELTILKERAATLGLKHSNNIGVDALRKKINDHLEGVKPEPEPESVQSPKPKSARELLIEKREKMKRDQMKLVRCRIYNMNPSKRELHGEIITVANKYLGTVRKFVPFGEATENGYHIPWIIYQELKDKKFQQIRTKKRGGNIEVDNRMVPEYNIEILPPLSRQQLKTLGEQQAAAQRLGAD